MNICSTAVNCSLNYKLKLFTSKQNFFFNSFNSEKIQIKISVYQQSVYKTYALSYFQTFAFTCFYFLSPVLTIKLKISNSSLKCNKVKFCKFLVLKPVVLNLWDVIGSIVFCAEVSKQQNKKQKRVEIIKIIPQFSRNAQGQTVRRQATEL